MKRGDKWETGRMENEESIKKLVNAKSNAGKVQVSEDTLTEKILKLKIATRDEVINSLGNEEAILKAFYLSLALLYDEKRRDSKKPYFIHSYIAAAKPDYRFNDRQLPSNFRLITFEKCLALIHDLREVYGKNLIGSYVIGQIIKNFFGDKLAEGLDDLTDSNAIVIHPIENSFEKMGREKYVRIKSVDVSQRLEKMIGKLKFEEKNMIGEYTKIKRKLEDFIKNVKEYHPELDNNDKSYIIPLIRDSFIDNISSKLEKMDVLNSEELTKIVKNDFEHTLSIVNEGRYIEVDEKLIYPGESPYLITLDKTLYQDFIEKIMKNAIERLKKQIGEKRRLDDSLLSVPIVRISDTIATIATLEPDMVHAINQFRKARIVDRSAKDLISKLEAKRIGFEVYERFAKAVDYSNRLLISKLRERYEDLKKKTNIDNTYKYDAELLDYMLTKVKNQ